MGLFSYPEHMAVQLFCLLQEVSHRLARKEGASRELSGSAETLLLQPKLGVVSRSPPAEDLAWPMSPISWLLACAHRGNLCVGLSA